MSATSQADASRTITWSARRINTLAAALGATRYLEIGVNRGATFRDIALPQRVGVDPRFLFDAAALAAPGTRFHEVTSDAYFEAAGRDTLFDICFLDGLHTFEQTLRDFCNTLPHSHRRTVWLIDDTWPSDVFSAMPDMQRAYRFRHMTADKSQSWHGDVFKLVFFLHDFFPTLNYRTIKSRGNPQTLVWQSSAGSRRPLFNDLEAISRLSFFDMHDNIAVMREAREEEALALCIAELGGAPGGGA